MWNSNFLCSELIYWLHGWIDSRFPYAPPLHFCNSGCNKHGGHTENSAWIADKIKKESMKTTILVERKKVELHWKWFAINSTRPYYISAMNVTSKSNEKLFSNRPNLFEFPWISYTLIDVYTQPFNFIVRLHAFWNRGDFRNGMKQEWYASD